MMKTVRFELPAWSALFTVEIVAGSVIALLLLFLMKGLGPQNTNALLQYDDAEAVHVTLPFSTLSESEYFNVRLDFTLRPIHATRFVVGPDDCIEELMMNGSAIEKAKGLCDMHPGHAFFLPNLHAGENTLLVRIHDTGGKGGLSMRVAFTDPLLMSLGLIFLLLLSWLGGRILFQQMRSWEMALLPLVLSIALLIRILPIWHGGFGGDIGLNKEWGRSALKYGLVESYERQINPEIMKPNYPPLSIMTFAATGYLYERLVGEEFDPDAPLTHIAMKIPAIIADLFTVVVLFLLLLPLGGRRGALVAATAYAVNPAVLHDSAIWGQTDALFMLFVCIGLLCVQRRFWVAVGATTVIALLFKMQALIILPVLLVVAGKDVKRWLYMSIGGICTALVFLSPFLLQNAFDTVWSIYRESVGFASSLSSNAYNLWVMLYTRETGRDSADLFLDIISYRQAGILIWFVITLTALWTWRGAIRNDLQKAGKTGMLVLTTGIIAYAFFVFNAEMHERYLFPYMALGLPLLFTGKNGITLYITSTLLFLLNLTSLVAFTDFDKWLIQDEFGAALPVAIATAQVITFFLTWQHIDSYQRRTYRPSRQEQLKIREFLLKFTRGLR